MRKRIPLSERPDVQEKMAQAVHVVEDKKLATPGTITHVRDLLNSKEIRGIMEDILDMSALSAPQKKYLQAVFLERKSKKVAFTKAFGRDVGYAEEYLAKGLMENPVVKDFIEMVKLFYLRAVPIAALKEVEIMLDPHTKAGVKLEAAKDLQDRAGITATGKSNALPVNVTINIPQQHNTQVNVGKEPDA